MFVRRTQTRRTEDGRPYFSHRASDTPSVSAPCSISGATSTWAQWLVQLDDVLSGQARADCPPAVEREAQRIGERPRRPGDGTVADRRRATGQCRLAAWSPSVGVEQVGLWALEQLGLPSPAGRRGRQRRLRAAAGRGPRRAPGPAGLGARDAPLAAAQRPRGVARRRLRDGQRMQRASDL